MSTAYTETMSTVTGPVWSAAVAVPAEIRRQHPPFLRAVVADTRVTLRMRAEHVPAGRLGLALQVVRLSFVSDAAFAMVAYRARAALRRRRIPLLPPILHRLSMMTAQVCIGDPVVVEPGVYVAHGQIVVDGISRVRSGAVLFPWVTIGLIAGEFVGPTIGKDVHVGTGAKVLGPVKVAHGARVGANAVVLTNVPTGAVAVGVPARIRPARTRG